jgi:hypothetical protein
MFTENERKQILAQARAHLEKPTPKFTPRDDAGEPWRRAEPRFTETEPEPEPEPEYRRLTDAEKAAQCSQSWSRYLKAEIGAAIDTQHALVIEMLGELVANERNNVEQLLDEQRRTIEKMRSDFDASRRSVAGSGPAGRVRLPVRIPAGRSAG